MTRPESIIVRAPNWLGDCVMSLPSVDSLKRAFPEASVAVACRAAFADCYRSHPGVDEVIPCPASGGLGNLLGSWSHGGGLRPRNFDTGILLTNSFSTALWMWKTGCKRRIGFNRDGRGMLLTERVKLTPELAAAHQADYYLHLCKLAGADGILSQPVLHVPDDGMAEAETVLAKHGIGEGPYAVLAPVSAYGPVKDWPAERFAEVSGRVVRELNMPVVVTGVAANKNEIDNLCKTAGEGVINTAGQTGMAGFLGLIKKASLFFGNDSGGAHAAAACGLPTVVIFGITEPSRTRPLGACVKIIGQGGSVTPDLKNPQIRAAAKQALESISVDEVWEAIKATLGE